MRFALNISLMVVLATLSASIGAMDTNMAGHNPALASITDSERAMLEPTLNSVYFKNGLPIGHLRHRLVRIDTEILKAQLQRDWDAKEAGKETSGVQLQLFDDLAVSLKVESVNRNDEIGTTGFFGRIATEAQLGSGFNAIFLENGRLTAVIQMDHASYSLKRIRDNEHYVVLAQEPFDMPFD